MARDSMTLDEVIQFTKQALEKVNPDKRVSTEFRFTVWQVKQLLMWLEDYKQLKDDYADLDNRLRTANTENDELRYELKRANEIIRFQKEEFDRLSQRHTQFVQAVAEKTLFEPVKLVIDKETAKRMKLIGDDNNVKI